MRRLNLILGILGALALCGCTLDEPLQLSTRCGDKGHPLSMVVYNNIVCTPDDLAGEHKNDSCTQFLDAFKNNSCPLLSPLCIHENDDDDYVCSTSHCQLTHHEVDGQCEPNTVIHCGGHGVDCEERMPGWVNGSCLSDYSGGKCFATQCENGYELNATEGKCEALLSCPDGEHIYNGECEPDSVDDCGRHDFSCAVRTSGWVEGTCQKGICVPSQCDVGYELENGACVAKMICEDNEHIYKGACEKNNVINCGFHGNDCRQSDGWVDGDCVESRCFASACEEGYELNAETGACRVRPCDEETEHKYGKICEKNSVEHCGQHDFNCSGRVPGWSDGSCVNGRCEASACTQGYRFDTGAKACVALINCEENTHVSGEDCAPDSLTACGSDNNDCTKRAGWAEGSCVAADCVATACVDGYEVKDGQCVSAIKTCAHCASNEVCVDGRCVVTGCTQDCNTYNHATSGVCSVEGKCVATACAPNYHLYNGTCELNTDEHCGSHEVLCDSRQHEMCNIENGTCLCEDGYERYDGVCRVKGYDPRCDDDNYMTVTYDGHEIKAWCIKTVDDLNNIGNENGNIDSAYILVRDIELSGNEWNSIDLNNSIFMGDNHTIDGTINNSCGSSLFNVVSNSVIRDLYLNLGVSNVECTSDLGGVAQKISDSIIDNIHFFGSVVGYGNVGGVAVEATGVIMNSSFEGVVKSIKKNDYSEFNNAAGFVVGSFSSNVKIDNCSFKGIVEGNEVGGLVRLMSGGSVYNSSFEGEIIANGSNTGGIAGEAYYSTIIQNCTVNADIQSKGDRVGGIIGVMGYVDCIANAFYGSVSGMNIVGGIVGGTSGNRNKIIQCIAFGHVYGSYGEDIGGLYGSGVEYILYSVSAVDVHNARSGGLVGTVKSNLNISNTYSFGKMVGGLNVFSDVYNNGGVVVSKGYVGSWQNDISSFFDEHLNIVEYTPYSSSSNLFGVLVQESNGYIWGMRNCSIDIGPAIDEANKYRLPLPLAAPDIPICSRIWIDIPES